MVATNDKVLKIGFIGAGCVNFGGPEGPWDHATRMEQYCGNTCVVTAIVEPDLKRAESVLQARRSNPKNASIYASTKIFKSLDDLLDGDKEAHPDAMFIGLPPLFHGSTRAPFDVEVRLAKAGIHMFVEKPLSCNPPDEVLQVSETLSTSRAKDGKRLIVSIGYMLRYNSAVRKMQEILKQHGARVTSTVARYNCTYTSILKSSWWDTRYNGGPIVEQATHFCDLSRLFGGDVELDTVHSITVDANTEAGKLSALPVNEDGIKPEHRVPRSTSAVWRYKNGAIGSLNHALLLKGQRYMAEFEVWADGVRLVLIDPYANCKLLVRTPDSDEDQIISFTEEDMYLSEMKAFIDAIRNDDESPILSTYADAFHTFNLSWQIGKPTPTTSV